MGCEDYVPGLSAYADGAMTGHERTALEAHVHDCASCAAKLEELRALHRLLGADVDLAPSRGLETAVFAALAKETRRGAKGWLRARFWAPALVAAAAMVVAVVSLRPMELSEDEAFVADNQEMLAQLDLVENLDALEDFEVIRSIDHTDARKSIDETINGSSDGAAERAN